MEQPIGRASSKASAVPPVQTKASFESSHRQRSFGGASTAPDTVHQATVSDNGERGPRGQWAQPDRRILQPDAGGILPGSSTFGSQTAHADLTSILLDSGVGCRLKALCRVALRPGLRLRTQCDVHCRCRSDFMVQPALPVSKVLPGSRLCCSSSIVIRETLPLKWAKGKAAAAAFRTARRKLLEK
eukprot:SAG31_NODE_593_length_13721_cov_5.192175_7_plen_186_part_00